MFHSKRHIGKEMTIQTKKPRVEESSEEPIPATPKLRGERNPKHIQGAPTTSYLDFLPDEDLLKVLSFLCTKQDLISISMVNKKLHHISKDETLWKSLLQRMTKGFFSKPSNWRKACLSTIHFNLQMAQLKGEHDKKMRVQQTFVLDRSSKVFKAFLCGLMKLNPSLYTVTISQKPIVVDSKDIEGLKLGVNLDEAPKHTTLGTLGFTPGEHDLYAYFVNKEEDAERQEERRRYLLRAAVDTAVFHFGATRDDDPYAYYDWQGERAVSAH